MKRSISKTELAAEFGIHRDTLMDWIKANRPLFLKLKKTGYKTYQKVFTPQQVNLIYSYLS
jgi:Domain of unknown function (DUF4248)